MNDINAIATSFLLKGDILSLSKYGNGLINKTYFVKTTKGKYIIQEINEFVFKNVNLLMENIYLVTKYIKKKRGNTLELVKTFNNLLTFSYLGKTYRCYVMKEDCVSYENLSNDYLALRVGKAISLFQSQLEDVNVALFHTTIPYFHDLRHRYIDLVKAFRLCKNQTKKKEVLKSLRNILLEYEKIMKLPRLYDSNIIPSRICHYDTKLNNVLFFKNQDDCLIDLDTVMPGCSIYDYGDSARNIIVNVKEDEYDKEISINHNRFIYLTSGYLSVGKNYLTNVEVNNLVESIKVITLELSIRFLTDYLEDNVYFLIDYDKQNFYRSLCQYNIYTKIKEEEGQLKLLVKRIYERLTNIN